ncbi:unnamed protein product [Paramecium pentaurelia]|uniref:Uncharacterized protein n=1 Tax=Paramecium pentaurelia TaxID=43138 RepID=A0A8S1TBF3_9CILI|nr:unnamed protein product [Paramecium pentaurelia]
MESCIKKTLEQFQLYKVILRQKNLNQNQFQMQFNLLKLLIQKIQIQLATLQKEFKQFKKKQLRTVF